MKIFHCENCNNPVFFENTTCENCGTYLGYFSAEARMIALHKNQQVYPYNYENLHYCANYAYDACNWLLETDTEEYCEACQLNRTVPNLSIEENVKRWQKIEQAKHRLVYSLKRFSLPTQRKIGAETIELKFDFLTPLEQNGQVLPVMTGHDHGLITLNIKEANAAYREKMKQQMEERYRTLLGHFRHEVGHFYWEILVEPDPKNLEGFRNVFGDERKDYGDALQEYYDQGSAVKWKEEYISKYATAHPWEDWAESWAHYMHLIDALETAYTFGLHVNPNQNNTEHMTMKADFDPYLEKDFDVIVEMYIPMTFAVNSINRSMGLEDIYPFLLTEEKIEKLKFIHNVIKSNQIV